MVHSQNRGAGGIIDAALGFSGAAPRGATRYEGGGMGRIEEFTQDGKNFVFLDLSRFKDVGEFKTVIEPSRAVISKYPPASLYTITDINGISFDSEVKRVVTAWMDSNKAHVKYGAVIGVDGVKKIVLNSIFALAGRRNMHCVSTREEAMVWLLKQK
jgi:hypothetical protein